MHLSPILLFNPAALYLEQKQIVSECSSKNRKIEERTKNFISGLAFGNNQRYFQIYKLLEMCNSTMCILWHLTELITLLILNSIYMQPDVANLLYFEEWNARIIKDLHHQVAKILDSKLWGKYFVHHGFEMEIKTSSLVLMIKTMGRVWK